MDSSAPPKAQIWWSNGIFFVSVHLAALIGLYMLPPTAVPRSTLILAISMWQLAEFGWVLPSIVSQYVSPQLFRITIGYHRLWSHRAFRAHLGVRVVLAVLGSAGFQGSIKVSNHIDCFFPFEKSDA